MEQNSFHTDCGICSLKDAEWQYYLGIIPTTVQCFNSQEYFYFSGS